MSLARRLAVAASVAVATATLPALRSPRDPRTGLTMLLGPGELELRPRR